MARPRKTLEALEKRNPDWVKTLKDGYSQGKSNAWARVELGIKNDLWYYWLEREEKFSEVIKECNDLARVYFENQGKKIMNGEIKRGNASVLFFMMKNRFPQYSEKLELKGSKDSPLKLDVNLNNKSTDELETLLERIEKAS